MTDEELTAAVNECHEGVIADLMAATEGVYRAGEILNHVRERVRYKGGGFRAWIDTEYAAGRLRFQRAMAYRYIDRYETIRDGKAKLSDPLSVVDEAAGLVRMLPKPEPEEETEEPETEMDGESQGEDADPEPEAPKKKKKTDKVHCKTVAAARNHFEKCLQQMDVQPGLYIVVTPPKLLHLKRAGEGDPEPAAPKGAEPAPASNNPNVADAVGAVAQLKGVSRAMARQYVEMALAEIPNGTAEELSARACQMK
jgi:hypothetical protein